MTRQPSELPVALKGQLNRLDDKNQGFIASALELAVLSRAYAVPGTYTTRTKIVHFTENQTRYYAVIDDPAYGLARGFFDDWEDCYEEPIKLADPTVAKALATAKREGRIIPLKSDIYDLGRYQPDPKLLLKAIFGDENVAIQQCSFAFRKEFVSNATADVLPLVVSLAQGKIRAKNRQEDLDTILVDRPLSYDQYLQWARDQRGVR